MRSLHEYLCSLQERYVQLNSGGPEACQGWLEFVQADYVTLRLDDERVLHRPIHHIRSITPLAPPPGCPALCRTSAPPPATLVALLQLHLDQQIIVNLTSPEACSGILRSCADEYLLVEFAPGEAACFPLMHLRCLCVPAAPLEGR